METAAWEKIQTLMESGAEPELIGYLDTLNHGDLVRAVFRLSGDDQQRLLRMLPAESAAIIVEEVPEEHAAALLEALDPAAAAPILAELASDDLADVLVELDTDDAEAILRELPSEDAAEARQLISYPEESAGGLMMTEFLAFPPNTLVRAVLKSIAEHADVDDDYDVQHLYVVDGRERLLGMLKLSDLVLAEHDKPVSELMTAAEFVSVDTDLDALEDFFEDHEVAVVPVASTHNQLVGVARRRAVLDAVAERAEEDRLKAQGIVGGEELRAMPTTLRSRRRLSWLSINIVLNMIAASVIAMFEQTLAAVIALAVFLPIVSDMSGCSGNQAVAVSLRELTLDIIRPIDFLRVWFKEASVGLINGVVLGFLLGVAAWLWKDNAVLGLVVGSALAINTLVAVSIGGTVPLLLKAFRVDPAVASGPILTTVTDMCGFFLVLGLATIMLPWLQAA